MSEPHILGRVKNRQKRRKKYSRKKNTRTLSWPSGGTRQTAAISLTASRATWGLSGLMDLREAGFEFDKSFRTLLFILIHLKLLNLPEPFILPFTFIFVSKSYICGSSFLIVSPNPVLFVPASISLAAQESRMFLDFF